MDLIIDANILFAALIKKGLTSEILFKNKLYAPEFIFIEFEKYKKELLAKTERTEQEFNELFELFQRNIVLIPAEEMMQFIEKAELISPDKNDSMYFALAMKLNCAIWSNDKELKKQKEIKIYSTEDLIKLFY